ncbi:MAG: hypothetical protein U5M23_13495 [Marinagarivorans sp.]|nr:hypothetical protein [Marinagarivorans sp.]
MTLFPPLIEHNLTSENVAPGSDHLVTAKVTDDNAVASVILHYRQKGTRDFTSVVMKSLDNSSRYEALIVGTDINSAGIEYFFEAADSAGNTIEMYRNDGEPFAIAVVSHEVSVVNKINITVPDNDSSRFRTTSKDTAPKAEKSGNKTWLWIGLGVLAAVVVAGAAGGGGGGSADPAPTTGDLDIAIPIPVN